MPVPIKWFLLYPIDTKIEDKIVKHEYTIKGTLYIIYTITTSKINSYIKSFHSNASKYFVQNSLSLNDNSLTYANNTLYKLLFANIPLPWLPFIIDTESEIYHNSTGLSLIVVPTKRDVVSILPPVNVAFRLFYHINPEQIKVIIIGQDPYPQNGIADGLAFSTSIKSDNGIPPSLNNIFKELIEEGFTPDIKNPELTRWATQGVLLINTAFTVEENKIGSHTNLWKKFVEELVGFVIDIRKMMGKDVVGCMFGSEARTRFRLLFTGPKFEIAHPSPNSCDKGFFGSNVFKNINEELVKLNETPIDWS